MGYAPTSYNRIVCARRPVGGGGAGWLESMGLRCTKQIVAMLGDHADTNSLRRCAVL
jgi:hypothetical protein